MVVTGWFGIPGHPFTPTPTHAMISDASWIQQELPDVERLYRDECIFESKRRGTPVGPHDPVVRVRVADRLLNGAGERIRRRLIQRGKFPDRDGGG